MSKYKEFKSEEMTLEEARAYRASLYKPEEKKLSASEKRDAFKLFWARSKSKYQKIKANDLENILWSHLKSIKQDDPKQFENGLSHFGLKKVK